MTAALFVQVGERGGALESVQRELPEPGAGQLRIRVEACGICRGDELCRKGHWPGVTYPRVPGHEVVGIIDKVGEGVSGWSKDQRVGAGWVGDQCHKCDACRRGHMMACEKSSINGLLRDGGYAQYMTIPCEMAVKIPQECTWDSAEIAPLMCAGVTMFNPLSRNGIKAGALVAIQGIGGLGHLGIQFARKMGFRVAAISGGADKERLSIELGAHIYINASKEDPVAILNKHGGAALIMCTAPDAGSISQIVDGLARFGKMVVVAAPADKVAVSVFSLLPKCASIQGWAGGTPSDVEDTIAFATAFDIKPMVETFPLSEADRAYKQMESNKVRFRSVLDCR